MLNTLELQFLTASPLLRRLGPEALALLPTPDFRNLGAGAWVEEKDIAVAKDDPSPPGPRPLQPDRKRKGGDGEEEEDDEEEEEEDDLLGEALEQVEALRDIHDELQAQNDHLRKENRRLHEEVRRLQRKSPRPRGETDSPIPTHHHGRSRPERRGGDPLPSTAGVLAGEAPSQARYKEPVAVDRAKGEDRAPMEVDGGEVTVRDSRPAQGDDIDDETQR
jgi:hypothetical protein